MPLDTAVLPLYKKTANTDEALLPVVKAVEGGAKAAYAGAGSGFVPYFVSGPLSRNTNVWGAVGTLLHVGAWIAGIVVDFFMIRGQFRTTEDEQASWDKVMYDYWLFGYLPYVFALLVVIGATLFHIMAKLGKMEMCLIKEGEFPPYAMTFVTSGVLISIFFFFLMLMAGGPASGYCKTFDAGSDPKVCTANTDENAYSGNEFDDLGIQWRRTVSWSIVFKFFVFQFLRNNQEWAGPADAIKAMEAKAPRKTAASA